MVNTILDDKRRRFHRVFFDAPAHLYHAGVVYSTQLLDVSLKGALVAKPERWPLNIRDDIVLRIALNHSGIVIEMSGFVIQRDSRYLGFSCTHIDMESITHLRRLIELNLGDSELLERDIEALS